jgi:PAS domain S-box-containing protein
MSQSTFSKVFKSLSLGEPEPPRPDAKESRPPARPTPRANALPPVRVLYLTGETREITFVTGTFDKVYPHLVLDFSVPLIDVPVLLSGEARHEAVVVGWSVPEQDALPLITAARSQQPQLAIVAIGERTPEQSLEAGADEFVQRGATLLTRLPLAIEDAVKKRREIAAAVPRASEGPAIGSEAETEVRVDADVPAPEPSVVKPEPASRAASARLAFVGDLQRAREAVEAEGAALEFVALSAHGEGAKCVAIVVDQSHAMVDVTQALADAVTIGLPAILLYEPEAVAQVMRTLAGSAEEFVAKESGWARQVALRLEPVAARHRRTVELAAVKAREARVRATIDGLPAAVVRLSPEGTIMAANAVALSLLGATEPRQLLRKQFHSLVTPPNRAMCMESLAQVCNGESRTIDVWATTLTGESRALQINAVHVTAEENSPPAILTVVRDVTKSKRLEASLERGAAETPVPVVEPPPVESPAIEGQAGLEVFAVEAPAAGAAGQTPDADTLRALEGQLRRLSADARQSFESLESSLRDAEAQHDAVSARKRQEQAAFDAAQAQGWKSYDAFVQATTHPIVHVGDDGAMAAANPAFVALLGAASFDEIRQRAAASDDLTPAADWRAAVYRWREAPNPEPVESRWKRADGAILTLLLHGRRIGGQTAGDDRIEVIVENVTQRRSLEHQLQRARRWEGVAKVTTGIAGDLQNAVSALTSSAERAADPAGDPAASQAALAEVREHAAAAASLSRQLVTFGRRESRQPEPIDVNDVVRGLDGLLRRMVDEHVDLTFELAPQIDLAQGDRATLDESLVALIMSAGSSMPAGGQLVVSTRMKDFESRAVAPPGVDPGAYAVVSITAIGWGIADSPADGGTSTAAIAQAVARSGARLATYVTPGQSLEFAVYLALAAEVVEV